MRRKKLIENLSILVIWLPSVFALGLWKRLPDQMPVHFNGRLVVDGWCPKPLAIFSLPIILTLAQLLIAYFIRHDPKNADIPEWINYAVMGILPVVSILVNFLMITSALEINISSIGLVLIDCVKGILLIVLGIILGVVGPNQVIGIRLPWTLNSSRNWRLTHRFGSKMYIVGGILLIVCGLLGVAGLTLFILLTVIILPCVYSYMLYKKGI